MRMCTAINYFIHAMFSSTKGDIAAGEYTPPGGLFTLNGVTFINITVIQIALQKLYAVRVGDKSMENEPKMVRCQVCT